MAQRLSMMAATLYLQFILIIMYFGEAYGWRGYLCPKLEKLYGTVPAVFISGIIWGVWHTPVLLDGHNFGREMKFFPISNIALMCLMCIFLAPFHAYVSKKSNSIWPAACAHFFINNLNPIMLSAFLKLPEGEISEEYEAA